MTQKYSRTVTPKHMKLHADLDSIVDWTDTWKITINTQKKWRIMDRIP